MKTRYTVALSMLAGVAVGAAAVQGLHAQAKPPVYTVTEIDVKNVDAYLKEYTPVVQPIIKKHGGTLLAASLKVTALEGTAPKRVAINRWESLEAAQALYNSAEFKAAQQIGNKYATFRRYAVEVAAITQIIGAVQLSASWQVPAHRTSHSVGRGAYAIRALPDLCLGIVSGRLGS